MFQSVMIISTPPWASFSSPALPCSPSTTSVYPILERVLMMMRRIVEESSTIKIFKGISLMG